MTSLHGKTLGIQIIVAPTVPADVKRFSHKPRFKYHLKQFLINDI